MLQGHTAIMQLASNFFEGTAEESRLIESIRDETQRNQAYMYNIVNMANRNPADARRRLANLEIPDQQRQQLESMINQIKGR
ncbi:MAG: hypothetical protein ACE5F8_00965 [Woeseiaceae bacterium]